MKSNNSAQKGFMPTQSDVDEFLDGYTDEDLVNTRSAYATALSMFLSAICPLMTTSFVNLSGD
jgi:hypothetical protein